MKLYLIAPSPTFGSDAICNDKALNISEKYALMASLGITTVAALLGEEFDIHLCDELIDEVNFELPADVVGLSMNVAQAARGIEIARRFRAAGRKVLMGGPHVSLAPDFFAGEADSLVIGEFETVADQVRQDLKAGSLKPEYRCGKADLSEAVLPRWDLYTNSRAITGAIQTSRGCPFECNFCDVIQYLGRVQRHKSPDRVMAEAQYLYDLGYRSISLSDDNFTVYRKKSHAMLERLAAWNGRDGRDPVQFQTQASIDLARDGDLIEACNQAGLRNVFIGLETSDEDALRESGKRQNLRQDLIASTRRIAEGGLLVSSGLIVGFDSDDLGAFERQLEFAMALPVVNIRVSVLVASIATPLYADMKEAGRLIEHGQAGFYPGGDLWSNIEPLNMSRRQLAEGAAWLSNALFSPENALRRFEHIAALLGPPPEHLQRPSGKTGIGFGRSGGLKLIAEAARRPALRRVIEAVSEMGRNRPEIASDLSASLFAYLNTTLSMEAAGTQLVRPAFFPSSQPFTARASGR